MGAPEWHPGMDRVTGMAAHPSTQRKTTAELRARLRRLEVERAEADTLGPHADLPEYLRSLAIQRDAYLLALAWRDEAPC